MGWAKLASTTLASVNDTIDSGTITAKKFLHYFSHAINSGNIRTQTRYNSDTGSNFATRGSHNGGADSTNTSLDRIYIDEDPASGNIFSVVYGINISTQEKLIIVFNVDQYAIGAAQAPHRRETVGKWSNTSDAITSVQMLNDGTGDFAADSNLSVLGTD